MGKAVGEKKHILQKSGKIFCLLIKNTSILISKIVNLLFFLMLVFRYNHLNGLAVEIYQPVWNE